MKQHRESAGQIAVWLERAPQVARVHYPGLPSHPQYDLAQRQMKGSSSLLSFELNTDRAGVRRFINSLRFFGLGVSWGGYESLVWAPLIQQEVMLPPEQWLHPTLVRIHVGLEDPADLQEDLAQALRAL
jgi:cystathionine gamma-lyase